MRLAIDYAGDAFPAQEPNAVEQQEPQNDWSPADDYRFVWAGGRLEVASDRDFEDLLGQAGIRPDYTGPLAMGNVHVDMGKATWEVETNTHAAGLVRLLKDYCKQKGWRWGGLTDIQGEPVGTGSQFAPVQTHYFRFDTQRNHLYLGKLSKLSGRFSGVIHIDGRLADVRPLKPEWFGAVKEWADDQGLQIVSGNDNVIKRVEDLEQDNIYTPEWNTDDHFMSEPPKDDRQPGGVFKCPVCSKIFPTWRSYMEHRQYEGGMDEPEHSGEFPELNNDATFPPHFHEQQKFYESRYGNWDQTFVGQMTPIAQAYERAPVRDPHAVEAWRELARDSIQRAHALRQQYNISETDDPEPYADAHAMFNDLNRGNFVVSRANSDHPLWTPDENVAFRITHDILGHYPSGGDFTWAGENQACGSHFPLLTPNAQKALFTECIGQTAYANHNRGFGPQKMAFLPGFGPSHFGTQMPEGGFCHRHLRHGIYSLYKQAAPQPTPPKDQIPGPIPFIYDIKNDQIVIGQPGGDAASVPGRFTPGGVIQGTYEPGGKVHIQTDTNMPYTVRHLLDLWYAQQPALEITGVELVNSDGSTQKLARKLSAQEVGPFIQQLAAHDPAAHNAWRALSGIGGQVYVVGGAVRDTLLQKRPKDLDLMVSGVPANAVMETLERLPGRVDLTGKDFGVFRYRTGGHEVEIALPRTEKSTGERRVDFDVQVDHRLPVEKDLERRDFTANSMAVDLDSGQLVDPFGGANDIAARRLQTTHPNSFQEDATRLVRALVASSRHGLTPTEGVRREIVENASRLDGEARERVQAELDKLFASDNPAGAIRLAQETGLLRHIMPDLHENFSYDQNNPHHNYALGDHLLNVLEGVQNTSSDPDLRLAALLHDVGKPASAWTDPVRGTTHYYQGPNGEGANHEDVGAMMASDWMRGMKYPAARTRRVAELISHHMYPDFSSLKGARKFLNRVGDHADDLMTLRTADREGKGTDEYQATKTPVEVQRSLVSQVRAQAQPTNQSALAINGNDLINAGIPPGPQMGRILQQLTEAVLEDPQANNPATLLDLARQYQTAV